MAEYNKENVKLLDSQLNNLKAAVKNRQSLIFENEYQNV